MARENMDRGIESKLNEGQIDDLENCEFIKR